MPAHKQHFIPPGYGYCYMCNTAYPASFFEPDKSRSTGLASRCPDCQREYMREYMEKYRAKKKASP